MIAEKKFEAICVDRFGAELLVQSIKKPFIVDIFEELLKTKNSDNEIYFDQREEINDKSFNELFEIYRNRSFSDTSIPIGIIKNDGTYELNPEGNRVVDIENEKVILISRNQPI